MFNESITANTFLLLHSLQESIQLNHLTHKKVLGLLLLVSNQKKNKTIGEPIALQNKKKP